MRRLIVSIALVLAVLVLAVPEGAAQRTRTDIDSGGNALLLGRVASTVQTIVTDGTINSRGGSATRVTATGNVTGIILQKSIRPGHVLVILNVGAGTITFAAVATSNVSYGTSAVIQSKAAAMFVWDDASDMWHPLNP